MQLQPTVWQWYLQRETGRKFEVIDVDADARIIEIQDEDGDLNEIDFDSWAKESLETTEEPEDFLVLLENQLDSETDDASIEANAIHYDALRAPRDETARAHLGA